MPIHFAPRLRGLEEALESNGLIKTLDSAGVTAIKAAESAGKIKVVPVAQARIIRGSNYTAS